MSGADFVEASSSITTTKELIPVLQRNERLRGLHEKHMKLIGETDPTAGADPVWMAAYENSIVLDHGPVDAEDDLIRLPQAALQADCAVADFTQSVLESGRHAPVNSRSLCVPPTSVMRALVVISCLPCQDKHPDVGHQRKTR